MFVQIESVSDELFFFYIHSICAIVKFIYRYYCAKDGKVFKMNIKIDNDGCNCSCKRCSHHKLILAEKGLMESGMKGDLENLVESATQDGMLDGVMVTCDHDYMNGVI